MGYPGVGSLGPGCEFEPLAASRFPAVEHVEHLPSRAVSAELEGAEPFLPLAAGAAVSREMSLTGLYEPREFEPADAVLQTLRRSSRSRTAGLGRWTRCGAGRASPRLIAGENLVTARKPVASGPPSSLSLRVLRRPSRHVGLISEGIRVVRQERYARYFCRCSRV